ncbi:FecR family protein [Seonamhaeicola marinus]|uniref:DUF4974 domain-containing protein n=1 Tax=Seonamhaeicola marinus TaxID=1912246 RepID=A0A5D0J1K9_9FLAO|nr:FecR domain-containing protein [Seonamhaeicola marinus]TYA89239.1 DUF4974 domain-containing protein [Seonamhaeicola marinus]
MSDNNEDIKNFTISNEEKAFLKKRIFKSIRYLNRKKRIKYYSGVAAAVLVLLGFSLYYYTHLDYNESSITDYVKEIDQLDVNTSNEVTIVLGGNIQGVKVKGESTNIKYSETGEQIDLGNNETLNQTNSGKNILKYNTLLVPYGKRSSLVLSDGTTVWLNSGSKIIYPIAFKGKKREVYIEGEAIFDVTHNANKPFVALTSNQRIEVLGTVFNVSSYQDDVNDFVVLKSGKVKVANELKGKWSKGIDILPGTKANFDLVTKETTTGRVDVEQYFAWRDGVLILKNNDLNYIMRKLSRYYNTPITITDKTLSAETFSGYLDLKDNLENAIQVIKESTSLDYTITSKNEIIITN